LKYPLTDTKMYNAVLLGDSGVGKSALLERYACDQLGLEFCDSFQPTIGLSCDERKIRYRQQLYRVSIYDLSGNRRFETLYPTYLRTAEMAFICVSVTDRSSYDSLEYWINKLKASDMNLDLVSIVGCKSDMANEREVLKEEAQGIADDLGFPYFETSSKNGDGVSAIFSDMARRLHEYLEPEKNIIHVAEDSKGGEEKCCRIC